MIIGPLNGASGRFGVRWAVSNPTGPCQEQFNANTAGTAWVAVVPVTTTRVATTAGRVRPDRVTPTCVRPVSVHRLSSSSLFSESGVLEHGLWWDREAIVEPYQLAAVSTRPSTAEPG